MHSPLPFVVSCVGACAYNMRRRVCKCSAHISEGGYCVYCNQRISCRTLSCESCTLLQIPCQTRIQSNCHFCGVNLLLCQLATLRVWFPRSSSSHLPALHVGRTPKPKHARPKTRCLTPKWPKTELGRCHVWLKTELSRCHAWRRMQVASMLDMECATGALQPAATQATAHAPRGGAAAHQSGR